MGVLNCKRRDKEQEQKKDEMPGLNVKRRSDENEGGKEDDRNIKQGD